MVIVGAIKDDRVDCLAVEVDWGLVHADIWVQEVCF